MKCLITGVPLLSKERFVLSLRKLEPEKVVSKEGFVLVRKLELVSGSLGLAVIHKENRPATDPVHLYNQRLYSLGVLHSW